MAYTRKNHFFSAAERSFYDILRRLTPRHTVFAKVRLAELVDINRAAGEHDDAEEIEGKQVDFVLCDSNLAPVVAIDLNENERAAEPRDHVVEQVLAAAAV